MAKLHELLAVEGNLKGQADKVRGELTATFEKKRHLFTEKRVTFLPLAEGATPVVEEQLDLQTTVRRELRWFADLWAKAIDAGFQVDEANTHARADVLLADGTLILKQVPATALLQAEKRLNEFAALIASVPTLDPAKGYQKDSDRGKDVYVARLDTRTRTKKEVQVIVGAQATKEHPAQVQYINVDVPTGSIQTQEWSGLVTPAEKADMLDRCEDLRRAVKQARSRANEQAVKTDAKLADTLLSFVLGS